MHERTTRKSVTFLHPFSLAGVDEKLEAGTYIVETVRRAYRRIVVYRLSARFDDDRDRCQRIRPSCETVRCD